MIAIKLFGPVRYVVVGSPRYFQKAGRPMHPKELLTHDCLRVRLGDSIYDRWEFEQRGKPFQVQVKGSLIFDDSLIAVESAMRGDGLMYMYEDAVAERIKAGKLEAVLETFSATSTGFFLYYPKRAQVLPKLRAFIEHLKELP